jgi:hypothetical protein
MTNALLKYVSGGEASLDNFEAYLSFCESNDTLPRAPFTVWYMLIAYQGLDLVKNLKNSNLKVSF